MASERLTPLDTSFLHLEDGASHMHVAAAMVFEGPALPYQELLQHIQSRLHLIPRYRQRLAPVPLGQGRPKWVDDEHFDLRYHVRDTALPAPGGDYELQVLAARVFSQPLNRARPLWEMWLVEGLPEGRFALLSKTHHAVVDGISGLDMISVLFSDDEDPGQADWRPEPAPGGIELLVEALWERATQPAELVRPVRALLRRPQRAIEGMVGAAAGLGAFAWAGLRPAPETPYNRDTVGGDRHFTWVEANLDDVKAIKNELGGTVNDVVLSIVARGLRRHLLRLDWAVEGLDLKAFVPVSLRDDRERTGEGNRAEGNRVGGMIAALPVGCPGPVECLRRISDEMDGLKESGQPLGAQALTELAGFAPPNLLDQGARLVARQRFVNLVITNVPGPQHPLQLAGRELLALYPLVPLGKNLTFGVAIVSYNGRMFFGLVGDFDTMPDLDEIADDFREALVELADAAGVDLSHARDPAALREPAAEPSPEPEPPPEPEPVTEPELSPPIALHRERDHVNTGEELVAEVAEPGAEDGAGPQVRVGEPWPGYDGLTASQVAERLPRLSGAELALVQLYEETHAERAHVLRAAEDALAHRAGRA
jgi:diacylglycerol O-acyltransferase / wax synthase